jgi:hypothetical protein
MPVPIRRDALAAGGVAGEHGAATKDERLADVDARRSASLPLACSITTQLFSAVCCLDGR